MLRGNVFAGRVSSSQEVHFTCTINTLNTQCYLCSNKRLLRGSHTGKPFVLCWCCSRLKEPAHWCCLQGLCWSDPQNGRKCRFFAMVDAFLQKICRLLASKATLQTADSLLWGAVSWQKQKSGESTELYWHILPKDWDISWLNGWKTSSAVAVQEYLTFTLA